MSGLSVVIPSKTVSNFLPCAEAVRRHEPSATIRLIDDGMELGWLPREDLTPCFGYSAAAFFNGAPFIFARNVNLGIEKSGSDDVVVLNDDALLESPGGFSAMQKAAELNPEYGIISATTNLAGNPDQQPRGVGLRDSGGKSVAFVCVLVPRRTIDLIGLLDERFTAYGWEDNDYCRRVREAGLKIGIFDGCFVDHASLTSTFRGSPNRAGNIHAGMEIYRQKWGDTA